MKNVRLVTNIHLENNDFYMDSLKVTIEDREEGSQLSSARSYNTVFGNVTDLFIELRVKATEVFNSILAG